jgi:WD40 repeat protein
MKRFLLYILFVFPLTQSSASQEETEPWILKSINPPKSSAAIVNLAFDKKGQKLTAAFEKGLVKIWDCRQWKLLYERQLQGKPLKIIFPEKSNTLAVLMENGELIYIHTKKNNEIFKVKIPLKQVQGFLSVKIKEHPYFLIYGKDEKLVLVSIKKSPKIYEFKLPWKEIRQAIFLKDRQLLLCATEKPGLEMLYFEFNKNSPAIKTPETPTEPSYRICGFSAVIKSLYMSDKGYIAWVDEDNLYGVGTFDNKNKIIYCISSRRHRAPLQIIVPSEASLFVLLDEPGILRIIKSNVKNGRHERTGIHRVAFAEFLSFGGNLSCMAFPPQKNHLLATGDREGCLKIWNLKYILNLVCMRPDEKKLRPLLVVQNQNRRENIFEGEEVYSSLASSVFLELLEYIPKTRNFSPEEFGFTLQKIKAFMYRYWSDKDKKFLVKKHPGSPENEQDWVISRENHARLMAAINKRLLAAKNWPRSKKSWTEILNAIIRDVNQGKVPTYR